MNKIFRKIQAKLFKNIKDNNLKAKISNFFGKILIDKKMAIKYDTQNELFKYYYGNNLVKCDEKPDFNYSYAQKIKRIENIFFHNYTPKTNDVILDIGAGDGSELLIFQRKIDKFGKIISIEASKNSFRKLDIVTKENNYKNCININLALSNYRGKIYMEETDYFIVNRVNSESKGYEIEAITFDELIMNLQIEKIDYLKINIEGSEFDMIDGMHESIGKIKNIAISCHDFLFENDNRILNKVESFLIKNNFRIVKRKTGSKIIDSWIYGYNNN